jgi:transcriptional regulator with XRE-family HTH domain
VDPTSEIGRNIRARRQRLGLSLEALAKRSGVSSTMLSEVERSVKNPTVKLAYQIAKALSCTLTDLLDERPVTPVTVIRADQRRTLVDPQSGVARHGLRTELLSSGLEVVWYELPAGTSAGEMEPNRPGVTEHVSVLKGTLSLKLGEETYELNEGDSVSYAAHTTMEYRNDSDSACEILLLSDSSQVAG